MSTSHYIQYPPDSTGKRAPQIETVDLYYTSGTIAFLYGNNVITPSGFNATVIYINGTLTSGYLRCLLIRGSQETAVAGEVIQVNSVTYALVNYADVGYYTPKTVLVSGDDTHNYQHIDGAGAAYVRFTEGAQQLDAFGISRVSQQNILGEYIHTLTSLASEWQSNVAGGGTTSYLSNESSLLFQVGTAAGDLAQLTTNRYHRYQSGISQLVEMTMMAGDSGKSGLVRRGGYYDNNDGVFFELSGSTLNIVLRTSVTGSVVETRTPSTSFNGDPVNGTGLSGVALDVTKMNIFWFDFQWLGAGRVRFGIFAPSGERITVHTLKNANTYSTVYMKTATLPMRLEMFNSTTTASISQMKLGCASVKTEGPLSDTPHTRWHHMQVKEAPITTISNTYVPLLSLRSTALINGQTNRAMTMPETLSAYCQTAAIRIKMVINANLSNATWGTTLGCADTDTTATAYTGGTDYLVLDFPIGASNEDIDQHFDVAGRALKLLANGAYGDTYTFVAKTFEPTANVALSLGWIDTIDVV